MALVEVKVDASALTELAANIEKAKGELIARLAAVGADIMREEAPFATGNLYQGIAPTQIDREGRDGDGHSDGKASVAHGRNRRGLPRRQADGQKSEPETAAGI